MKNTEDLSRLDGGKLNAALAVELLGWTVEQGEIAFADLDYLWADPTGRHHMAPPDIAGNAQVAAEVLAEHCAGWDAGSVKPGEVSVACHLVWPGPASRAAAASFSRAASEALLMAARLRAAAKAEQPRKQRSKEVV